MTKEELIALNKTSYHAGAKIYGWVAVQKNGSRDYYTSMEEAEFYSDMANCEILPVYCGYGYHGGGRPRKDASAPRTKTVSISGTEYEIARLKDLAELENKTVSRYVIDSLVYRELQ